MKLVDTSVWIEVFRSSSSLDLESILDFDEVVTCLPVVQEVLQGFGDEGAHRRAKSALLALPMVESPMEESVVLEAVDLYRAARKVGLTVRSTVDCLIAACAIRHDLEVVHVDRDFAALARVSPLRHARVRRR